MKISRSPISESFEYPLRVLDCRLIENIAGGVFFFSFFFPFFFSTRATVREKYQSLMLQKGIRCDRAAGNSRVAFCGAGPACYLLNGLCVERTCLLSGAKPNPLFAIINHRDRRPRPATCTPKRMVSFNKWNNANTRPRQMITFRVICTSDAFPTLTPLCPLQLLIASDRKYQKFAKSFHTVRQNISKLFCMTQLLNCFVFKNY